MQAGNEALLGCMSTCLPVCCLLLARGTLLAEAPAPLPTPPPLPQDAVEAVGRILGMQACEGTDAVPPNARSHTLLLSGTVVGDVQVGGGEWVLRLMCVCKWVPGHVNKQQQEAKHPC